MYSVRAYLVHCLLTVFPATRLYEIKCRLFRWAGAILGENVRIVSSARILTGGCVSIGPETFIGHDCLIVGGDASVDIGAHVDIGPRVTLATGTHRIQPEGLHVASDGYSLPITIGEGSWVCAGAIILGGTIIGPKSIVAAGAVVKGEFPGGCLLAGIPAKVRRDTLNVTQDQGVQHAGR